MTDSHWIVEALERYEVCLIRYATSILGDRDRARDVVQETFLQLCKERSERIAEYLAPWLFRVCRNRALDFRRKERPVIELSAARLKLVEDRTPGPAALLEAKETRSRIDELLGSLSSNQQEVLRLKLQAGLSYKEISEATGLSVSNVGFLIHTGLKKIRARVETDRSSKRVVRRAK